ncbi:MAG TPA: hypothetical protein VMY43_03495 [Methanothrix sp.]|nr:hypothetical protein [Methanothrix sp.]
MKHMRIKIMGIALLMLLFSVSTVYGQQENKTSEIINNLEQMRPIMLEKLVATISVSEQFALNKGAATSSCNKENAPNTCTYKFESGEVLSETLDASGYLVTDSFEDDANNRRLDTEYTTYNRSMCYTFMDTLLQLSLKVCYPCAYNTTSTVWLNQTLMNYTTGDTITWTLDCDGSITKRIFTLGPGAPLVPAVPAAAASALAPYAVPVDTTEIPSEETCGNTGQSEIRAPLPS